MPTIRESLPAVGADRVGLEPIEDTSPALPVTLDQIADELSDLNRSIAALVAQMDVDDVESDDLDVITDGIVVALARVEQLRCARAWFHAKARSDESRWAEYLDVA